ncbi:MAG: F0F1 ATP synthase subunit B [Flavobacteriales bacterium]|jgi:F-type H+-transporting ATPase subunit b|nr:ATP synthase F0 subunit B [Flavobacteriales bacterium]
MDALLTPAFGTVVWSTIAFLVVLFLLRKMAWGPILTALKEREESIATALNEADKARSEMSALQADNERLLQEARAERDGMLREAREMADKLVADAKGKAKEEAAREAESAREAIATERKAAVAELKSEVAKLSVSIAEQLIRAELADAGKQEALVSKLIDESPLK